MTETFKLAFEAIWAHKLRSFLTLLGVIIGVTAFMTVLSMLQGFSKFVDEKIAGIGSNSYSIRRFNPFEDFKDTDTIAAAQRRNKDLTFGDLDYLKSRAALVDKIGARANSSRSEVKRGSEILDEVQVSGAQPIIAELENFDIAEGRFFNEIEEENSARVAYIGADIADKLFPFGGAVGNEISIKGIPYKVVGVAKAKGTVFGMPQDYFIITPLKTYGSQFGGLIRQRGLYFVVKAKSDKLFADSVDESRNLMRSRRRLASSEKDNFGVVTPDAITGIRDRLFAPIGFVFLTVPGIALIVGGIVVMNIMLVAVTERTKEIGIRKSLGARQSDILRQFLFEAATLSIFGGLIGLLLAWILGFIISQYFFPTYIPLWAIGVGIAIPAIVGIAAGLFPAWKAARLDPIEALRAD
ncbi:MAG: ABC transporter permease [Pyrinomonadaceae bacterium]|nr:ABC transporter permease [Pyrinomonadaceae bacterium]